MPLDLQPGVTVPIPCRRCGQACIPFRIEAGTHRLTCPRCAEVTLATASLDEGQEWRIRTAAPEVKAAAPSRG